MSTTTRLALPVTELSETPPDLHVALAALAARLDIIAAGFDAGALVDRPSAGHRGNFWLSTDRGRDTASGKMGQLSLDNGASWIDVEPYIPKIGSVTAPGFTPKDGDLAWFGFLYLSDFRGWLLRYLDTVSARKWAFAGGAPIIATPFVSQALSLGQSVEVSMSFSLPAPGKYLITGKINAGLEGAVPAGGFASALVYVILRNPSTNAIIGSAQIGGGRVFNISGADYGSLQGFDVTTVNIGGALVSLSMASLYGSSGTQLRLSAPMLKIEPIELGT